MKIMVCINHSFVGLHVCGLVVGSKTLIQGSWILEENKIGKYVVVYCLPICSCANFILFYIYIFFINLTDKKKYHTSVSQIYGWIGVDCSGFPINEMVRADSVIRPRGPVFPSCCISPIYVHSICPFLSSIWVFFLSRKREQSERTQAGTQLLSDLVLLPNFLPQFNSLGCRLLYEQ